MDKKYKKILLTGGGTGGSVTPLLAIAENLGRDDHEFLFVGTKNGVEKEMVKIANIKYKWIHAGKLRRYFSWDNFTDVIKIIVGFFESLTLLVDEKPDIIISAGSFASVPLVWGAWFFNIPILIHQMDIRPGLANRLMSPAAKKITTVFEKSVIDYGKKAEWTGNPVKKIEKIEEDINKKFKLKKDLPVILIIGGGTGAVGLNNLVYGSLEELTKICQIVHSVGKGKIDENYKNENYHPFEYIEHDDLFKLLPIINLAVSRAGIGALIDIASFKKPIIIIPMPDSHQEDNADYFLEKGAAVVLDQNKIENKDFVKNIKNILEDKSLQEKLKTNIERIIKRGANERVIEIIETL